MNLSCPFRRDQHQIIKPPMASWIKRNCPDPSLKDKLFMYRHILYGTFVVALWVKPGWFIDVLNLGGSLGNFNSLKAHTFIEQFSPAHDIEQMKNTFRKNENTYQHHERARHESNRADLVRSQSSRVTVGYSN